MSINFTLNPKIVMSPPYIKVSRHAPPTSKGIPADPYGYALNCLPPKYNNAMTKRLCGMLGKREVFEVFIVFWFSVLLEDAR